MAGAVAPLILMIKKEMLTLKTQQVVFCHNNRQSGKQFESCANNISREIEHLFCLEGITLKTNGAAAPIFVMFKNKY